MIFLSKFYIKKENLVVDLSDELINKYSNYNGEFGEDVANYLYETSEPLKKVTQEGVKNIIEDSMLLILSVYYDSPRLFTQLNKKGAFTYDH